MKLLVRKNAMKENIEMAAMINTGDKTGFSAAFTVANFKKQFQAKGINIFYAQANFTFHTKSGKTYETLNEWHHWFEYADIDVVGKHYTPTINGNKVEYPQRYLDLHDKCQSGDTK